MGTDKNGDVLWVGNSWGANLARIDIGTHETLMHASATRSNTVRKTSVLRNRSLRARENAEWSGTLPSIERSQNQR
jgi:hypothetical protein